MNASYGRETLPRACTRCQRNLEWNSSFNNRANFVPSKAVSPRAHCSSRLFSLSPFPAASPKVPTSRPRPPTPAPPVFSAHLQYHSGIPRRRPHLGYHSGISAPSCFAAFQLHPPLQAAPPNAPAQRLAEPGRRLPQLHPLPPLAAAQPASPAPGRASSAPRPPAARRSPKAQLRRRPSATSRHVFARPPRKHWAPETSAPEIAPAVAAGC